MSLGESEGLPTGWAFSKLGDVITLINGRAYSQHEMLNEGTPILRIQNLNRGKNWFYSNLNLPEDKYCVPGDLLYAWSATFGPYWWHGERAIFHYHIWNIKPTEYFNIKFAYYELLRITQEVKEASHGVAMPHMTKSGMEAWEIMLPPLSEQIRIANKLDALLSRVEAGRERLERVPKLVKRFRQSVLSAAVSGELTREWRGGGDAEWEETNLGSLIESGPKNGLYKHSSDYGTGTKILRIGDFYEGEIIGVSALKRLRISSLEQEEYSLSSEDVIVNRVNSFDYLGKTALVRTLTEPIVFESNMMRIKFNKMKVLPSFCVKYLCSEYGKSQIRRNAKHAVNQASINQSDVKGCEIQLPSLPEQAEIVRWVEALFAIADRLEARCKAASTHYQRLTPALLAKAFRGELVEQDPDDEPASVLLERIKAVRAVAGTPAKAGGRGRRPEVPTPGAELAGESQEPQSEPRRGRGRPRKVPAEAGQPEQVQTSRGIPVAASAEEAMQLLQERARAERGGRESVQAGLFEVK
jgi:type I restriction enzyme, S subunit